MKKTGKIILVTGGARSGKSEFAERLAQQTAELLKSGTNSEIAKVGYVATAEAKDQEMIERIEIHQQRRLHNWVTYEAPSSAPEVLAQAAAECPVILFDCLTVFVANELFSCMNIKSRLKRKDAVLQVTDCLLSEAIQSGCTVIFVTNELGMGIVPENALAREYRDVAGLVNQKVAELAEQVFLVVSGIPIDIKALAYPIANLSGEEA